MTMRVSLSSLLCVLLIGVATAAWMRSAAAARHALLIGVSSYPEESQRLLGPPNDVALLWHALRARGVTAEAIRVLAEKDELPEPGIPTVARPTRAAIVAELERLAATAVAGDEVFISYSGHGSRQPDTNGDEADGYDEIFLPADIGRWTSETAGVENALVDDEIGRYLSAIRERGAFVWMVIDACHSGTGTRAAGGEYWRTRQLSEGALGVPAAPTPAAPEATRDATPAVAASEAGQDDGSLVAFFAAQADEPAVETVFPRDYQAENRRPHGMLSFFLARAMTGHPGASYRDLAQHVLAGYDGHVGQAPQPLFEGALDRPAFGADAAPAGDTGGSRRPAVRLPLDGPAVMSAGLLHGVIRGQEVRLYDLEGAAVAARARVTKVGIAEAELEIEADDIDALPWRLAAEIGFPPSRLVVSRPKDDGSPDLAALDAALAAALETRPGIVLVPPDGTADIHLRRVEGQVWLLPPGGLPVSLAERRVPTVPLTGDAAADASALARQLSDIRRSRALLALLARLDPQALGASLDVRTHLWRAPGAEAGEQRACPRPPSVRSVPDAAESLDPVSVPQLAQCDTLYVSLRNRGTYPVDVTAFYIGVTEQLAVYPGFREGRRLEPGAADLVLPLQVATWDPGRRRPLEVGSERLLIIGVERREREELPFVLGLGHLAGDTPRPATRSAGVPPVVRALEGLVFPGQRTRSAEAGSLGGGGAVAVRWSTRVLPPAN